VDVSKSNSPNTNKHFWAFINERYSDYFFERIIILIESIQDYFRLEGGSSFECVDPRVMNPWRSFSSGPTGELGA